jgi:predicted O-methyltransferase YrrM
MSQPSLYQRVQKIDSQAHTALLPTNNALATALSHALSNSAAKGLPPITVSPLQGQYLAIQAQLISARRVLEIGTLGGYSTIWFASTGASVTSLEINAHHRDVAVENVRHAGYADSVDIILGDALETLPKLAAAAKEKEGAQKFDLVFIDADWALQYEYFEWAMQLVRPGGCIYVDNAVRAVTERGADVQGKETLFAKVGRLEGVQATLVSVLSSHKGHEEGMFDGFLLAIVKG